MSHSPDGLWADDRAAARQDWAGWLPLPKPPLSDHDVSLLMPRSDMIEREDIDRLADDITERVRPQVEDVQRRVDAEMRRLDARATKEVNRWSGYQWAGMIAGVLALIVVAFFIGRATVSADMAMTPADIGAGVDVE